MKSLLLLWKKMAEESAIWCCTSATMDCKTVQVRSEHEGLSFLTITLPSFGKDLQRALDQGYVDRRLFVGFQRKGGLPRFLGGFLDLVFDRDSGVLLDEPNIEAILALRQLTLMFGKMLLPCSDARENAAMRGYIQCEQDVRKHDALLESSDRADFQRVSAMLFSKAFSKIDRDIYEGDKLIPRHGPGATADKLRGNAKYRQTTWPERLDKWFPLGDYLLPNHRYYDELEKVTILEPGAEIPVRVISVPKTLKTPRIIGVEPTAMQYAQQAVLPVILDRLSECKNLGVMLGFDDQTPNQRMALEGSLTRELATLDLSEASDRVSNQHVRSLLRFWPSLHGAVDACRSRKADVSVDGEVKSIRLSKFASMGSALCFPFEAMVFLTIIFIGIERSQRTPLTPRMISMLRSKVRVYGDDIIVPVDYVHTVVPTLEAFGFRVSGDKSFWTGKFRESCGKEYYDGEDVSIVRVRNMFPAQRQDATGVISIVSLRNQLFQAGYWSTVKWLDKYIRGVIRYFPDVSPSSPVLGRHTSLGYQAEKMHETLFSPLVKGWQVSTKIPTNSLDGSGALLKCLLRGQRDDIERYYTDLEFGRQPSVDKEHLERSGRPQRVDIKLRYASPW